MFEGGARSHRTASPNCWSRRTSLLWPLLTAMCVCVCVCRPRGGPEPRPDVHQTPRRAANTERNAYARRGQTTAAPRRPVERARPRGGGHLLALVRPGDEDLHATDVGGMSNASAIGVRGLCGRGACRVRRPPDPARARGGRAVPWLVPPASWPPVATGAWQIVAGRVRPHENIWPRTARAPGARCGASGARSTRRAADLSF